MLAYVFWHRPGDTTDAVEYEEGLRAFHGALESPSGSFRLEQLPFGRGGGYEDWYLVESWSALGELNALAVDALRRDRHDRVAGQSANGWGGVYELWRGEATIPAGTEWVEKPRGEPAEEFIAALPHAAIWRRQLTLGPAPELCCAVAATNRRARI